MIRTWRDQNGVRAQIVKGADRFVVVMGSEYVDVIRHSQQIRSFNKTTLERCGGGLGAEHWCLEAQGCHSRLHYDIADLHSAVWECGYPVQPGSRFTVWPVAITQLITATTFDEVRHRPGTAGDAALRNGRLRPKAVDGCPVPPPCRRKEQAPDRHSQSSTGGAQ